MTEMPRPSMASTEPPVVPQSEEELARESGRLRGAKSSLLNLFESARAALPFREDRFFLLLAIIVGVFAGLAVVLFRILIDYTRLWLLGSGATPEPLRTLLVPTIAGLALALLVIYVFPRVRGSGVTQTKSALYIYDGYIPFETVIGKFLTCSLAIGSGQSLGPEDPSLQMGAGIASTLGRRLHLSREKLRLIAPVGAAAGLAAAFNAPIAAVLFIIEEVIGRWSAGILGSVVLSAVSAAVVMRLFLGAQPLFQIPPYQMVHAAELLSYAALGICGGVFSLVFVKLLTFVRARFRKLPRWSLYVQPAAAGLIIGAIGLRFPQVMGAGYDYMDEAMHGQFPWRILIVLALLKIFATSVSVSSGAPGGMFAPTLFIGAMLGAAVGTVQHHFFPAATGPIGAYALVGMGTLFAGFLRAPMTSVFMVLEVSGNYSIIIPVMVSNTIAYVVGRAFQHEPIFEQITREEGLDLPSMEESREQAALLVEDAMRKHVGALLKASDTVADAWSRIADMAAGMNAGLIEDSLLVSSDMGRWTLLRKDALEEAFKAGKGTQTLAQAAQMMRLPRLHPDQSLDLALRLIRDLPFLPVVHRADARYLIGILSLDDILAAYRRASVIRSMPPE